MSIELQNLIQRAEAISQHNWLHAIHLLESAAEENPEVMELFLTLGDIYLRRKLYEKAIFQYQKAHALSPRNHYLAYIIGNCYFALNEYHLALSYYDNIPEESIDTLYNKALAYAYTSKHRDSVSCLKKVLQSISDNPFVYVLLVEQLIRIQHFDEAMDYIKTAEIKCGKHKQLALYKALIYTRKSIWLQAYSSFRDYEEESPINNPDYLHTYGNCAWKIGLVNQAISLLNRARGLNPHISALYEDLCRLYIQIGRLDKAEETIDAAEKYLIKLSPVLMLLKERIYRHNPQGTLQG
ncbi:MAG: tetratricopeptide repeat protein [Candidatus Cloacimonetes bacterium]|nr:tetratricopeptide repeat protein [Candidatus Cloacimonadota bacterium]